MYHTVTDNPPLLCNAYLVMYDTHIEIKHRLLLLLPFVVLFPPQGPRGTPGVPGPLGETGLPVSSMNFYHSIFLYTIIVYIEFHILVIYIPKGPNFFQKRFLYFK